MLIDAILDRKYERENGIFRYDPRELYNYINGWAGNIYNFVVDAMDKGTEEDVKKALCDYIDTEYPAHIKDFVNSVDWLTPDPKKPRQEIFQEIRAYKSREDMYRNGALDLKFAVNENPSYKERYENDYALGVAWGLTAKYSSPCVKVLTTIGGKTEVTQVHHAFRSK